MNVKMIVHPYSEVQIKMIWTGILLLTPHLMKSSLGVNIQQLKTWYANVQNPAFEYSYIEKSCESQLVPVMMITDKNCKQEEFNYEIRDVNGKKINKLPLNGYFSIGVKKGNMGLKLGYCIKLSIPNIVNLKGSIINNQFVVRMKYAICASLRALCTLLSLILCPQTFLVVGLNCHNQNCQSQYCQSHFVKKHFVKNFIVRAKTVTAITVRAKTVKFFW